MKYLEQKYSSDDTFKNILNKYFKAILEPMNKIEFIKNSEKGDLISFAVELLNETYRLDKNEVLLFFEKTNRIIDDYLEENEQLKMQFDNLYNILLYSVLSDIFYLKFKLEKSENELHKKISLLDNKNFYSIIYALYENKFLSQSELAKYVNMSPQNLSNQLAKLKPHNILYVFKSPANEKSTYYSLNVDFNRFIRDNTLLSQRYKYKSKEPINTWMLNFDEEYFISDIDENEYEIYENNEFFDYTFLNKRLKHN